MTQQNARPAGKPIEPADGAAGLLKGSWHLNWLAGLLLILAIITAYLPARHAGFIWDDDVYVIGDQLLTAPDGLKRIWFSLDAPSQYFPLTYTTFRFERSLWGLHPAGYHWDNIALHTANALLLWWLLRRLAIPGAWLAAAIFALHPVQVESVAWITERKNLLSLFFSLLTLRAWVEFVEEAPRQRWDLYALSLVLCALALSGKTTACTLPVALLLVIWYKGKPLDWRRWLQVLPFVLIGLAMGLLAIWWERYHQGVLGKRFSMGPLHRLLLASRAIWFYAGKLIWPVNLTFSYPRWIIDPNNPLAYVWLVSGVAAAAGIHYSRRFFGRGVEVAALFYVATLSPLLGFVMLYTFRYTFVADHYQYVASIGPLALAAAGLTRWLKPFLPRQPLWWPALCGGLLLALGALTWHQCGTYADLKTLWRDILKKNPQSWMGHLNLGTALEQDGKMDDAMSNYREAIRINPEAEEPHNDLGFAMLRRGQVDEAIAEIKKSVEINPGYAHGHNNLGIAFLRKGRVDEAIAEFQKTLELEPANASALNNLGIIFRQKARVDDAIAEFRKALLIDPAFAEGHHNLGNALLQKGQVDEAIAEFRKAIETQPAYVSAYNRLGVALRRKGEVVEAIAQFRAALAIQPGDAGTHNNLANALLEQGHLDEAILEFQKSLEIRPDDAAAEHNLSMALLQKGRLGEAVQLLQRYLERQPKDAATCRYLAWIMATCPADSIRNGPKAVELAQQAARVAGGDDPVIGGTLAAAYAEAGRFPEAVREANQTLQKLTGQSTAQADALRSQLKLYQIGVPFRDTNLVSGPQPALR